MLTYDSIMSMFAAGDHPGVRLGFTGRTRDGKGTYDSTGAFLVGELERLDMTLHLPLIDIKWGRDIDLREDVTLADENSSFTTSTFGTPGSLGQGSGPGYGISWAGKKTDQISSLSVDIAKTVNPLTIWAKELTYTIPELASAAQIGRPIDEQKHQALNKAHEMDVDQMVYVGDTTIGQNGLCNQANTVVTNVSNVANGSGGSPLWANKTPDEILADVNTLLVSVWKASAYAVTPSRLLLSPLAFGYISTQKIGTSGSVSIKTYLEENNILTSQGEGELEIFASKWLLGGGASGTLGTQNGNDRMVAYTKNREYVRYPMTMLQRTPVQFTSIFHAVSYFCRLGVLEIVYPQTLGYADMMS